MSLKILDTKPSLGYFHFNFNSKVESIYGMGEIAVHYFCDDMIFCDKNEEIFTM